MTLSRRDFLKSLGIGTTVLIAGNGLLIRRGMMAQEGASHIRHASVAIIDQLDPQGTLSNVGFQFARQVYDTLVSYAPDGGFLPQLATAWERIDETTLELTLREGVLFHNGDPFNAETVVFNVNRMLEESPVRQLTRSRLITLESAEAVDDLTVRITTTGPDPILLNRLAMFFMVNPTTVTENDDDLSAVTNGTGYFRVADYAPGTRIELEVFEDNWRGVGAVTSATMQAIVEPGGLLAALQANEVDIVYGAPPDQVRRLSDAGNFEVATQPSGSVALCSLIPAVEPALADVRVREAINLAVNKEEFNEAILAGYGEVANGQFLSPGIFGHNPDLEPFPYDPDRARELLAEAGAENLQLNIATTLLFAQQAEAIAGYLNAVGIQSEVEIQDLSVFIPTLLFQSEVPILYWTTDYFQLRDIANITRFGPQPEGVQLHFDNEEYVQLFAEANTTLDADERETIIQRMAEIMRDEAGVLFLSWPILTYPHADGVEFDPALDTAVYLWEVEKQG